MFLKIFMFLIDQHLVSNSMSCSPKCWKIMKFSNFHENLEEKLLHLEIYIWEAPHEENSENEL